MFGICMGTGTLSIGPRAYMEIPISTESSFYFNIVTILKDTFPLTTVCKVIIYDESITLFLLEFTMALGDKWPSRLVCGCICKAVDSLPPSTCTERLRKRCQERKGSRRREKNEDRLPGLVVSIYFFFQSLLETWLSLSLKASHFLQILSLLLPLVQFKWTSLLCVSRILVKLIFRFFD